MNKYRIVFSTSDHKDESVFDGYVKPTFMIIKNKRVPIEENKEMAKALIKDYGNKFPNDRKGFNKIADNI